MHPALNAISDQGPGFAYAPQAVLEDRISNALVQTNLAFLELLVARHARAPGVPVLGLAPATAAGLAQLDARGREAAAGCPYTVFNLGFEDGSFWRGFVLAPRAPATGGAGDEAAFARTAAFLAWHLVQGGDLTATLVLGMTSEALQAWRALPLSALDRVALAGRARLEARWGRHRRFWPKLLAAAASGRNAELAAVRMLGLQLLAAGGIVSGPYAPGRSAGD